MAEILVMCPCKQNIILAQMVWVNGSADIEGIMRCSCCKREVPFSIVKGALQKLDTSLPASQSGNLILSVPSDLADDVKEAERAHFAKCYKAAALNEHGYLFQEACIYKLESEDSGRASLFQA
jgi:hypothetical protein